MFYKKYRAAQFMLCEWHEKNNKFSINLWSSKVVYTMVAFKYKVGYILKR